MPFRPQLARLDLSGDIATAPVQLIDLTTAAYQATWTGVTGFDATMVIQVSNDPDDGWNDIRADINTITLDTAADTQVWELLEITGKYVRLLYTANSNTSGTATVRFLGNIR